VNPTSWASYDSDPSRFHELYEEVRFERVHRAFLRFLPDIGARVLDVGAGSGRDAEALANRGYRVTAVEPSAGMRQLAERHHKDARIVWVDDSLPALTRVRALRQKYEFILVSAVWMHLSPDQRPHAMTNLARLLSPNGRIAITLRLGPEIDQRSIYEVDADEVLQLAKQNGLVAAYQGRVTSDSFKRVNVRWRKILFVRSDAVGAKQSR
jgi:2-polyprenyl-3-methyl-5-hydroxy-6-metoxy-1,4-benzoquinol methylase